MKGDHKFDPSSPDANEPLPPFTLITTDGVWLRNEDFAGRKLLLTFGSIT
jgi:hypothetical protein